MPPDSAVRTLFLHCVIRRQARLLHCHPRIPIGPACRHRPKLHQWACMKDGGRNQTSDLESGESKLLALQRIKVARPRPPPRATCTFPLTDFFAAPELAQSGAWRPNGQRVLCLDRATPLDYLSQISSYERRCRKGRNVRPRAREPAVAPPPSARPALRAVLLRLIGPQKRDR